MTTEPDELDALVLRYLEAVQAGAEEQSVLQELCESHPQQASALRRGVELLRQTRLHPGPSEDGLPDRVGPFRLLRRLGVGGMGVVYLAEQTSPHRQVALKLVRPDQLWFEGYRERFTREIESAGRLAHPGIAQVYEMGEHDGVPWFSQEFVVGAPLNALLANVPARSPETLRGSDLRAALADALEEPVHESAWDSEFFSGSWTETCMRVARQVAEALQHAHERGVLHRDVKPSNVILTPAGRTVLVDFGLASLQGSDRLTKTGAQLGSLHYMPPEQVDGLTQEVGPRSDVYSLGVTLYELFTLRAPYASQSVQRLRGLILAGDAPPARTLNGAVSRDAAVVCATAMDPTPARRYETAAAFAADLSAVLGHRAVNARPAGVPSRLARWARRRPALAVATVAGVMLFVVAPIAFALQSSGAQHRLEQVNRNLEDALGERDELLDATLDGFRSVVRETAHEAFTNVPRFQEQRLGIIEQGLAIFERVVAARPEDLDVQLQRALMEHTRANILHALGSTEEALDQYQRAATTIESALGRTGDEPRWRRELGSIRYMQARSARALGDKNRAIGLYRSAIENQLLATELAAADHRNHRDLARFRSALANELHGLDGLTQEAGSLLDDAIASARRAAELAPDDPQAHVAVSETRATRGEWMVLVGNYARALDDAAAALDAIERAAELDPYAKAIRSQRIYMLNALAITELGRDRDGAAVLPTLQRALELSDALVADYPSVPDYAKGRIRILASLSRARRAMGDRAAGCRLLEEVLDARIALAAQTGSASDSYDAAVEARNLAGAILFDEELGEARFERMLALCDRADELLGPFERANPGSWQGANLSMFLAYTRGAAHNKLGQEEGLLGQIEALRELQLEVPRKPFLTATLLVHWSDLTAEESGRAEAVEELETAVEWGFADLNGWKQVDFVGSCADYPRVHELDEIIRQRAESN